MDIMDIGSRIKELRKKTNISQATLAKSIDVSSGNVGDWERGRAKPGADALISLMNFFGVSSDWILTGHEHILHDKPEVEILTSEEGKQPAYSDQSKDKTGHQKLYPATIVLTHEELDIITKYRQLDSRDQEDIRIYINIKYERTLKKGTLGSAIGSSGQEAATSDIA